jgi:release factor glutamine methyltransferase
MSSIAEALRDARQALAAAGVESPQGEARLLLAHATGIATEGLVAHPERKLDTTQGERFSALLARRVRREPMAHILKQREFWSLPFRVTADTLTPRPESETLIEAALAGLTDRRAPLRILDLGTGTGCLLLALLGELPRATGVGVDRSIAALAVAEENARRLGLVPHAAFRPGDWGRGLGERFNLVITNPPYIRTQDIGTLEPEVAVYEPPLALDGGADGLEAYRAIAAELAGLLAEGGFAVLEIGAGQADAVSGIMMAAGLQEPAVHADLAGVPRCLVAGLNARSAAKKTVGKLCASV